MNVRGVVFISMLFAGACACSKKEAPTLRVLDSSLPKSGQWRSGFSLVDVNGDGALDVVHGPARKGARLPNLFLGDGAGGFARATDTFPALSWDYGDVAQPTPGVLVFGVHLTGVLAVRRENAAWLDDSAGLPRDAFSSRALTLADWNGDGRVDVLALSDGPRPGQPGFQGLGVRVFERSDAGWSTTTLRADDRRFGDEIVAADFDGDGRADVATATHALGDVRIVDFGGEGRAVLPLPLPPRGLVRSVAAADVDGDGRAALFATVTAPKNQEFESSLLRFDFEDGAWKVTSLHTQRVELWAVGIGDFDGDGARDVVAGDDSGALFFWRSGVMTRVAPTAWRVGCRVAHVEAAPLDAKPGDELVASFALEDGAPGACPSGGGLEVLTWR